MGSQKWWGILDDYRLRGVFEKGLHHLLFQLGPRVTYICFGIEHLRLTVQAKWQRPKTAKTRHTCFFEGVFRQQHRNSTKVSHLSVNNTCASWAQFYIKTWWFLIKFFPHQQLTPSLPEHMHMQQNILRKETKKDSFKADPKTILPYQKLKANKRQFSNLNFYQKNMR